MIKQYPLLGSLTIVIITLLILGSNVYADTTGRFDHFIQNIDTHRAHMELKMGLDPQWNAYPQATSYYDDMVDHYEHVQMMSDMIDESIR